MKKNPYCPYCSAELRSHRDYALVCHNQLQKRFVVVHQPPVATSQNLLIDDQGKDEEMGVCGEVDTHIHARCPKCGQSEGRLLICRHCESELPHNWDINRDMNISVIGSRGAGKSCFIIALSEWWKSNLHRFGVSVETSMSRLNLYRYRSMARNMVNGTKLPPSTEATAGVADENVFIWNFRKTNGDTSKAEFYDRFPSNWKHKNGFVKHLRKKHETNLRLVFHDNAGEAITQRERIGNEAKYIPASKGMLIMLDIDNLRAFQRKHGANASCEGSCGETDYEGIENAVHQMRDLNSKWHGKFEIPVAVCIAKADRLNTVENDGFIAELRSNKPYKEGSIDLDRLNRNSAIVQRFLEEEADEAQITSLLESTFTRVRYFAVSAVSDVKSETSYRYQPEGVEDPFLWLMYQLNQIPAHQIL